MKRLVFLLILFCFSVCALEAQSKVAKEFEENAEGYKFFAYQSMLRMLNQQQDPDFNKLIRDLDHIRVVTTDSTGTNAMTAFKRLDNGIQAEGFEEILTFDNKEYKCHVYEMTNKKDKSTWVATFFMYGRAGILEMVGSLDIKYLNALANLNMETLKSLAPELENMDWD